MPSSFVQAEVDAQKMSVSWRKRQSQIMEVENYCKQGPPTRDPENASFENPYSEIDFCDSVQVQADNCSFDIAKCFESPLKANKSYQITMATYTEAGISVFVSRIVSEGTEKPPSAAS